MLSRDLVFIGNLANTKNCHVATNVNFGKAFSKNGLIMKKIKIEFSDFQELMLILKILN